MDKAKDLDAVISELFQDARDELGKIAKQAKEKKKQIVIDLAKNLDGKIRTDTICMEIVHQLHGQVSERFIRECLDEKYKEKVRVENARKQRPKKDKETDKLAAVTPLNQQDVEEEEEEEDKEADKLAAVTPLNQQKVAIVDNDGRTSIQDEDDEPATTTDSITDKNLTPVSYQQEQQSKNQANHDVEEMSDKNRELKEDQKSSPLITTDKMVSVVSENKNDILQVEFSIPSENIRKYMEMHQEIGDDGKVLVNVKINKKTGEVISLEFGKIDQQQQQDES